MAVKINIEKKTAEAQILLATFGDRLAPEFSDALNRAAVGVKTDTARSMQREFNVPQQQTRENDEGDDRWKIQKSSPDQLEATATVFGPRRSLFEVGDPSPATMMTGKTTGGVSVNIRGQRHNLPTAFVSARKGITTPEGVYSSYNKKYTKRLPNHGYRKLTTESIPQMVDEPEIVEPNIKGINERFVKRFDQQINRLLTDYGAT